MKVDLKKGDEILTGKWQNKHDVVRRTGKNELGQPTINGKPMLKFRIKRLMPKTKEEKNESMRTLKTFNQLFEGTENSFDKWKKALKLYKEEQTPNQEKAFDQIFKGSKMTARFIFRSVSTQNQTLYNKDCNDFGKEKVDDLVDTVLDIKSSK